MIVRTAEVEKGIGILTRGVGVWLSVNADTEPGSDPLSGAHIYTTVCKPGVCESESVCRDRSGKGFHCCHTKVWCVCGQLQREQCYTLCLHSSAHIVEQTINKMSIKI